MYEDIKIETDRLVIRNFTKSDLKNLHRIVNENEIMRNVPFAKERNLDECADLLDRILARYSESTSLEFKGFLLLVQSRFESDLIGVLGLFPLTYDNTEHEIFYGILSEHTNMGYATESATALIDYAFKCVKINKVVASVNKSNERSKKIMSKLGMQFDYVIQETGDNSYDDEHMYSRTYV